MQALFRERLIAVFLVLASSVVIVWCAYLTARFWLPPVACLALLVSSLTSRYKNNLQRQEFENQTCLENSRNEVAMFVQWLFCKNQRDALGIQAVPLVGSFVYLKRNMRSERNRTEFIHTVSIGLQHFNTASFYLIWESLKEPIDEALFNYCNLKGLILSDRAPRFRVVSVNILDGAVLPQIVLTIADRNFQVQKTSPINSSEEEDLFL